MIHLEIETFFDHNRKQSCSKRFFVSADLNKQDMLLYAKFDGYQRLFIPKLHHQYSEKLLPSTLSAC